MKNNVWMIGLIFLVALSFGGCSAYVGTGSYSPPLGSGSGNGSNVDISYFYDFLLPYGNWTSLPNYGYVWVPSGVGYQWRPYSDGRWALTGNGWTWVSNEPWGDITYHYGRWGFDAILGWYWAPDTIWGPAWVAWRWSNDYLGWAPLPPGAPFEPGMNLDIPWSYWLFVTSRHFTDRDVQSRVLPAERNPAIISKTTPHTGIVVRNNEIINEGISRDEAQRITRKTIPQYNLRNIPNPGHTRIRGNEVEIFRPMVRKDEAVKPKTIVNRDEIRQRMVGSNASGPHPPNIDVSTIRKQQNQERRLLQESHNQEIKSMNQRRTAEEKQAATDNERQRIRQDYNNRVQELQRLHQQEMQQMQARHQRDLDQAGVPKKKEQ
ncbi:MAG: DUF6600 domain-containing protein [Candidatus Omnitrophota bacterium]